MTLRVRESAEEATSICKRQAELTGLERTRIIGLQAGRSQEGTAREPMETRVASVGA
jgi:hypothetical protein